jgi:hypothetical protein
VIDTQAWSIPQQTSWAGTHIQLVNPANSTFLRVPFATGFTAAANGLYHPPRALRRGPPPLDLKRYTYLNPKPHGIAANHVTVCEFHGETN